MSLTLDDVAVHANRAMANRHAQLDLDDARRTLPGPLREVAALGIAVLGDRVFLRAHWEQRATAAQRMDRRSAERWVNAVTWPGTVYAEGPPPRPALLGWGIATALALFADAAERGCRLALQAEVRMPSPAGQGGAGAGGATVTLDLHSVQSAQDDLSADCDRRADPALTLTFRPV